jgi:hypothetical protein
MKGNSNRLDDVAIAVFCISSGWFVGIPDRVAVRNDTGV